MRGQGYEPSPQVKLVSRSPFEPKIFCYSPSNIRRENTSITNAVYAMHDQVGQ
jgi:hypothetical protein